MSRGFREFVDDVKNATDIVQIVDQRVGLNGRNKINCLYHDDPNASLHIYQEDQHFHCFGCGKHGDVIDFLMQHENKSFMEVLTELAKEAKIPFPTLTPEDEEAMREARRIEDVLSATASYYHSHLEPAVVELLKKRGISEESIRKFQIGYANGHLKEYLLEQRGFTLELCIKAGVLVQKENGNIRDYFNRRIIFPYIKQGRVLGFVGRRTDEKTEPKFLKQKGRAYGLYNEDALKYRDIIIIVEGPLDCIVLEQSGYHAVALVGATNFNPDYSKRLSNSQVSICLDGDEAGKKGTIKAAEMLPPKTKIITLPEGKDPDEYLLENGKDKFDELISRGKGLIPYLLDKIPESTPKTELREELLPVLNQLARMEEVDAEAYLGEGIKRRFGLHCEDVKAYRNLVKKYREELNKKISPPFNGSTPLAETKQIEGEEESKDSYEMNEAGIFWKKHTGDGSVPVQLTNFSAKIKGEILEDDGVDQRRLFEIETNLDEKTSSFFVPSEKFSGMNWVTEFLGARGIIYPGISTKDRARAAIQIHSGKPEQKTVYTHLGWRKIGEAWVYLHGGGAIGAEGNNPKIFVRLPGTLNGFQLPELPEGEELRNAVQASLRILELAPDTTTVPLFAAIWTTVLTDTDFSLHVVGPTGQGKTEMAALIEQHWGPSMDAGHLPASWSSTGNALEALGFAAKNAILAVDDYAPNGTQQDVRLQRDAERLLRAQGNATGRIRMKSDSSLRGMKQPRGLILSTGEDVPLGQSLRARELIIEHSPNSLDWRLLTLSQKDAADGKYAQALAGYIKQLAPKYEKLKAFVKEDIARQREEILQSKSHKRAPHIIATLLVGLSNFLDFARDIGAIDIEKYEKLQVRCKKALLQIGAEQAKYQSASDPAERFRELIASALTSGRAHVTSPVGEVPDSPGAWGWRRIQNNLNEVTWQPQGEKIGWIDGEDLFLEPDAAYAVAQDLAKDGGERISVLSKTLHKRLDEKGLLVSTEKDRGTLTVRKSLEGARHKVLHLKASSILLVNSFNENLVAIENAA